MKEIIIQLVAGVLPASLILIEGGSLSTPEGGNESVPQGVTPVEASQEIDVFPNPFSNDLQVNYQIEEPALLQVDLFSSSGQLMQHYEIRSEARMGTFTLPTVQLPPGIYYCQFWDGQESHVFKVLKQEN